MLLSAGEGHDKGGMEARGKALRRQALTPIPSAPTLAAINQTLLARMDARLETGVDLAGATIGARFAAEAAHFRPLPAPFVAEATTLSTVSPRALVRLDGAVYSIPLPVGRPRSGHPPRRRARHHRRPGGALIVHPRKRGGQRSIDYRHYLPELARKPQAVRQGLTPSVTAIFSRSPAASSTRTTSVGTAAAHYGLTTQHRNTIFLATPTRLRGRTIGDARVRLVTQAPRKFFGFEPVDVLGYKVMMSDREKTAIDCIDHSDMAGGVGEAAVVLAAATRRFDWHKAADYLARIDSAALVRRVGWLLDHLRADVPTDVRARLLQLARRSRKTWLGSEHARARVLKGAIGFDETWRVFVNVTPAELQGSAGLAQRKTLTRTAKKDS